MKSLNLKSFAVVLFVALCTFASCSKKKDDVAPPTMAGKWVGKWGGGNSIPDQHFAFTINANGTLTVEEGNPVDLGTGTWTLVDDTFKAIYSYDDDPSDKLNVAAKVNEARTKIEGSWGLGEVNADAGDFYMVKQ